jgi:hypothetical protein
MSTVPVASITVATGQNVLVAAMIYPLVAIVPFCSSDIFPSQQPSGVEAIL